MKILFVAVNYGPSDHARSFQRQFARAKLDHRVLLVDNTEGPGKGRLENELPSDLPHFKCVTSPGNLGYFGGMRHGLSLPFAREYIADWTVISNVDVHFDPDAVAAGLADLDPSSVACVAPSIVSDLTGVDLNPHRRLRPAAARMRLYKKLFHTYWGLAIYTRITEWLRMLRGGPVPASGQPQEPAHIYSAHGSFLILGRAFFAGGGTLDHGAFLFGEEFTIAEQARRMGKPVIYLPTLRIGHAEHVSTSKLPSRTHHRYVRESVRFVADTYFAGDESSQAGDRR